MTKINATILMGFVLLFLAGLAAFLFYYDHEGFTGNRIKTSDAYLVDIEKMNGTDLHTLDLKQGDSLQIRFETVRGSLYMEIKSPDGTIIYCGNGKETTDFTVTIPASGVYTVAVDARHAKGTIHIQVAQDIS